MQLRRTILMKVLKGLDLVSIGFALALGILFAYAPTGTLSLGEFLAIRVKIENLMFIAGIGAISHATFLWLNLYESKRLSTLWSEQIDLIKAISIITITLAASALVFHVEIVDQWFLMIFWSTATAMLILSRLTMRLILRHARLNGRNLRNVLIVGTNTRAVRLSRDIEGKPELGYRVVGFVDDPWEGADEFRATPHTLVSDFEGFSEFLRTFVVDEVMLMLPMKSYYTQAAAIAETCANQGVLVRIQGNMFSSALSHERMDTLGDRPLLTLQAGALGDHAVFFKRVLDICIAAPLLALSLPLLAVVALLVRLSGPGPIFFVQDRIGINKRRFQLIKFRTMVPDAEQMIGTLEHLNEVNGAAFKIEDDPRLTPIGKFLRKTSLDELPQLWNVLRGDMSLVGPRPLPVRDFEGFTQDWHRRRFSVPPGITCLWQVNGRSQLSFDKWMELDMQYIDEWSLWLDVKILLKTIPVVLKGTGAA